MEPLSVPPPIPAAPVLVQAADAAADTALRVAWKWYGLVVVPIVVIAVSVAIWFVATSGDHESVADPASVRTEEEVESAAPSPERLPVNASVSRLDARWLPTATRAVVRLRMSALAKRREIDRVLQAAEPAWHPAIGRVIDTLQLKPAQIERLTWAACDLADWKDQSVAVIELKEEKDSIALKTAGESLQLPLAGVAWRRIPKESWSHPFALLDSRTILTGREELLRELADRKEPRFESEAIERLFKTAAADAEILLMLDLAAARTTGWDRPATLLDVWPTGREPWHTLWQLPRGLGLTLYGSGQSATVVALVCDGDTAAEKARASLEQLVSAAKAGMDSRIASIGRRLQGGRLTVQSANQYELLLKRAKAALESGRPEVAGDIVWLRLSWGANLPATTSAALDSPRAISADWLDAAAAADRANHSQIAGGLAAYAKAEKTFPPGAGGGTTLLPSTRLSWIAVMLPYLGHRDWYKELDFAYSWNGAE